MELVIGKVPKRLKMRISKGSPFPHPRLVVRYMARLDHTKIPKITTNGHGCLDIKNTVLNVISNVSVTPIQANANICFQMKPGITEITRCH